MHHLEREEVQLEEAADTYSKNSRRWRPAGPDKPSPGSSGGTFAISMSRAAVAPRYRSDKHGKG